MQTTCIVGLGYIGLPSAALLASFSHKVIGVDIQPHIVDTINSGKTHLIEPGLESLVKGAVKTGFFTATLDMPFADIYVVTVPTPVTENKQPDLTYVKTAIENIAPKLKPGCLIILESTSPVGTTEQIAKWIAGLRPDLNTTDIFLAYCPERVMPGLVIRELVENDRVVGGINSSSTKKAISFYKQFVRGNCIGTTARTAEMTKLTENAFRDVNIAFANELSMICDQQNINAWELIALANRHPRVNILQPGPGVGGHCIAVDPWFIVASNPTQANLIRTARETNDFKSRHVLQRILQVAKQFDRPTIACLGITFKKDIDDLRQSAALKIVEQLAERTSGKILVVEPHIQTLPATLKQHGHVKLCDLESAVKTADITIILVAHSVFTTEKLQVLTSGVLIDTVGLLKSTHAGACASEINI